jgi:hypothetical protein
MTGTNMLIWKTGAICCRRKGRGAEWEVSGRVIGREAGGGGGAGAEGAQLVKKINNMPYKANYVSNITP